MRVKVHSGDDTRYIMVAPDVDFKEFVDRVREKFGIRVRFKLKVRDEGDLITMADGDDWEMAVQNVKKEVAKGEEGDMGKMEVSVFFSSFFSFFFPLSFLLFQNFSVVIIRQQSFFFLFLGKEKSHRSIEAHLLIKPLCIQVWIHEVPG